MSTWWEDVAAEAMAVMRYEEEPIDYSDAHDYDREYNLERRYYRRASASETIHDDPWSDPKNEWLLNAPF